MEEKNDWEKCTQETKKFSVTNLLRNHCDSFKLRVFQEKLCPNAKISMKKNYHRGFKMKKSESKGKQNVKIMTVRERERRNMKPDFLFNRRALWQILCERGCTRGQNGRGRRRGRRRGRGRGRGRDGLKCPPMLSKNFPRVFLHAEKKVFTITQKIDNKRKRFGSDSQSIQCKTWPHILIETPGWIPTQIFLFAVIFCKKVAYFQSNFRFLCGLREIEIANRNSKSVTL
jgi:hypothetical protein